MTRATVAARRRAKPALRENTWHPPSVATSSAPKHEIFHGEAELVVATGELGELGIAPQHAPLITRLKPGKVVVTLPGGEKLDFAISGGILEVQPQVVTVLADTAIRAQDIDEAAVLRGQGRGRAHPRRARIRR